MKSKLVKILLALVLLTGCAGVPSQNLGGNTNQSSAGNVLNYFQPTGTTYTSNWSVGNNCGKLNTSVSSKAKKKRTNIIGNNKDQVTILVYMCGSDLESQGAMATYDLQEMLGATISDNINLVVFTGGAAKWKNNLVSNQCNQIYQISGNGQIDCINQNAGNGALTDPNTLVSFLKWGVKNYKANRYELIFWDHGAGSTGGYGKDEKYSRAGSMSLAGIDQALSQVGITWDFIGFDACLMANTETALMVADYADYLIASEEAEPGIGWYYTDWLNQFSKNTSISTLDLGKTIVDSFVSTCKQKTPRQSATLSVIDLAEVEATIPTLLTNFSKSTNENLLSKDYKQLASARSSSREFATQAKVDLVDFVDLASKVNTTESKALADGLLSCVKYNNTSSDMSNAYGLSVYFPYRNKTYVSTVLNTYDQIGMNKEYTKCLKNFVNYSTTATVASGGSHNAYQSVQNNQQQTQSYQQQNSSDALMDLMGAFLGGQMGGTQGSSQSSQTDPYAALLNIGLNALLSAATNKSYVDYVVENHFDVDLTWDNGKIAMTKDQWNMVDDVRFNLFVDDGEGYIDLGKDSLYTIDEDGNLKVMDQSEMTWIAASIDEEEYQIVPYYYLYTLIDENDQEIYYGRIPVLYNGLSANLLVQIDDEGLEVTGIQLNDTEGCMVARAFDTFNEGDTIQFVCDYYDYDGNFSNTYQLGDTLTITDECTLYLGDVDISEYDVLSFYEIVDIYQQSYWTTPMN